MASSEFKAELHMHTVASDGAMSPEEAVRLASRIGLCCLSVTDHDTFRGSSLADRISRVLGGPLVIHGAEVRTEYGDVLVYCSSPHEDFPRSLHELRDWASSKNCLLVAAHPFHPGRSSVGLRLGETLHLFNALEVWNSRGIPFLNLPAIVVAERYNIPATSGSDAHVPQELGTSPVILPDMPRGRDDVLEWISKGLVRPSYSMFRVRALPYILAWSIARRLDGNL